MPDIVPAWMWRDPGEIIEGLLQYSARQAAKKQGLVMGQVNLPRAPRPGHDRYYTMARRVEIRGQMKRVMKGQR